MQIEVKRSRFNLHLKVTYNDCDFYLSKSKNSVVSLSELKDLLKMAYETGYNQKVLIINNTVIFKDGEYEL